MSRLILLLVAFFLANYIFFGPVSAEILPFLEILLVILLGAACVAHSFVYITRRSEKIAREPITASAAATIAPPPPAGGEAETAVVQFLGRLQEKGRLVDFALDDIAPYDERQVAAAARVVHQGCREVLQSAFDLQPVHGGGEGDTVTLSGDYDARLYRLVGKVPDRAPFRGTVLHRGWRTGRVSLPRVVGAGETAREVVAPAEVEVG